MLDKNKKPLIHLTPSQGLFSLERMVLKKSEEVGKKIPIIVVPEEAGKMMDEIQKIANENKVEVAIIGMGDSGKPKIPRLFGFNPPEPSCISEKPEEEKERGISFVYNDMIKNAEPTLAPTLAYRGQLLSSVNQELENKKPKKTRTKNNRKTKKRKKAKNGR